MLRYTTMRANQGFTRYHYRGMLVGSAFRYSGLHDGNSLSPVAYEKHFNLNLSRVCPENVLSNDHRYQNGFVR
jgi:hypothetical protein